MVKVRIQKIIWRQGIDKHISKHNVSVKHAESVIFSDSYIVDGHSGRKILVNRVNKRIISVIVKMSGNKLLVVTARDASKNERNGFYEYKKQKEN